MIYFFIRMTTGFLVVLVFKVDIFSYKHNFKDLESHKKAQNQKTPASHPHTQQQMC